MKSFKAFLLSSILLGFLVIILLYSNVVLYVYHPLVPTRPLDTAFIHAPMRLFLNLPLTLLLPVSILWVIHFLISNVITILNDGQVSPLAIIGQKATQKHTMIMHGRDSGYFSWWTFLERFLLHLGEILYGLWVQRGWQQVFGRKHPRAHLWR